MIYDVFLFTKIQPEYSDILYNPTHFHCPLVCRIRQIMEMCRIVQDVRTCLIQHTKEQWKCVGLNRMSDPV
jgi:hypothetical protein